MACQVIGLRMMPKMGMPQNSIAFDRFSGTALGQAIRGTKLVAPLDAVPAQPIPARPA